MLYRQILDSIEANDYDNFSKRAYVSAPKKLASLPLALARAMMPAKAKGNHQQHHKGSKGAPKASPLAAASSPPSPPRHV